MVRFTAAVAIATLSIATATYSSARRHPVAIAISVPADPIHRIIQQARAAAAKVQADQFADPASVQGAGTPFKLTIHPTDGNEPGNSFGGGPYWTYGDGKLSFTWTHDGPEKLRAFLISGRDVSGRSYLATNAFGAVRTIDVDYDTVEKITVVGEGPSEFRLVLKVAGEQARYLSQHVILEVYGVVTRQQDGKIVTCATDVLGPESDFLQEVHTDACLVGVTLSRVAFIDTATGKTLKSWDGAALQSTAETPPTPRPVLTNPSWLATPSADDVARYYPERARRMEIGGRAEITCVILPTGGLDGCAVTSEAPADQGFGAGALQLSKFFRIAPTAKDGVSAEGASVTVPISFSLSN